MKFFFGRIGFFFFFAEVLLNILQVTEMASSGPLLMSVSLSPCRYLLGILKHVFLNAPLPLLHICQVFLKPLFYSFLSFPFHSNLLYSTSIKKMAKVQEMLQAAMVWNLFNGHSPNPPSEIKVSWVLLAALKWLLPYGFVPVNLRSPSLAQGTLIGHCIKINTILWICGFSK